MTAANFDAASWSRRLEAEIEHFRNGTRYAFSIFSRESGPSGPLLGYVTFSEVVRGVFLACYMGYALAETAQGHGYMTEACRGAVRYIFEEIHLHRIMANYMPANERSARVLQRLGFTIEGTAKDYLFLAGRWQDHILTSLINPDAIPLG